MRLSDGLPGLKHLCFAAVALLSVSMMVAEVNAQDTFSTTSKAFGVKQSLWDRSLIGYPDAVGSRVLSALQGSSVSASLIIAQTNSGSSAAPDAAPVSANDETCDEIAALHLPYTTPTAVHEASEADWSHGVIACQASVAAHPGEIRFVYQLARAQDHTRSYVEAVRNYKVVIDEGFSEAMVDLGSKYYYGQGVLQNYPTAFDYMSKAAEAGSIRGMANVAAMLSDGRGTPKDDIKALDYAEKAVEAGNPFGLKIIADHYFNGAGVPRDYKMCAQYLQQAVDLGNGQAMKFLAAMYEGGYLGPRDPAKASELRLRAQKVDPESPNPLPNGLQPLKAVGAANAARHVNTTVTHRRYVVYHYNPAWQAAPGDTRCCPNNMLVCPLGRHFCGH